MPHSMRNPATVSAAYGVKPKPGYLELSVTEYGQPANQHTLVEWLASSWELTFTQMNGVDGYVAPTTAELQRLYDATTDEVGDPSVINSFLFTSMTYDIVLESANDARWEPLYRLLDEYAKSKHPLDLAMKKMFEDAKAGKPVENVWLEAQKDLNFITEDDLKDQPYGGRLPLPDGSSPATGGATNPSPGHSVDDPLTVSIIELYIAYFNRAPEHHGLEYWKNVVKERMDGGMSQDQAMVSIAEQFWPSALAQSEVSGYSESMSNWDFVSTIYANVLGRPDAPQTDVEGVSYWTNRLESGTTKGELVSAIIKAAHDYIDQIDDVIAERTEAYFNHRIEVAHFFSQEEYSGHLEGAAAIISGFNVMDELTYEYSTVQDAIAEIKAGSYSKTVLDGQVSARTMSLDSMYEGETLQFDTMQFNGMDGFDFNSLLDHSATGEQPVAFEAFDAPSELVMIGVDTPTDYDMFIG